jgi:pimeloyl-ACP methyl ester carboxylesterase
MHGWRSNWSQDFGGISPFWQENDCAVLYPEQRGQGGSGGEYMGFGLLERYDCAKWADLITKKTGGKLPVYLCGISMGATTVLMASGCGLPSSVHGIIADCGFTSPKDIWKHVAEQNLHIPYLLYGGAANDLCRKKIQVAPNSYSTTEALKENNIPFCSFTAPMINSCLLI